MLRGKYERTSTRFKKSGWMEDKFITKFIKLLCLSGEADINALRILNESDTYIYKTLCQLQKKGYIGSIKQLDDVTRRAGLKRYYLQRPERDFENLKLWIDESYYHYAVSNKKKLRVSRHKRVLDQSEVIALMLQANIEVHPQKVIDLHEGYLTKDALLEIIGKDELFKKSRMFGIKIDAKKVSIIHRTLKESLMIDTASEGILTTRIKNKFIEGSRNQLNVICLMKKITNLDTFCQTERRNANEAQVLSFSYSPIDEYDSFWIIPTTKEGALILELNNMDDYAAFSDEEILGKSTDEHFIETPVKIEINMLIPDIKRLYKIVEQNNKTAKPKELTVFCFKGYEEGIKSITQDSAKIRSLNIYDVLNAYIDYEEGVE